jgi:hypothetical protein
LCETLQDRDLETLLGDIDVWNMSRIERQRLHDHFREEIRKNIISDLADLERKVPSNENSFLIEYFLHFNNYLLSIILAHRKKKRN